VNYEILANGSDIYFDLQAGYYVQPRNVYKYNFHTKKLIKTQRNSIVNKEIELLKHQNQDYLLAKNVVATANTFTHEQAEKFRTSKNADSVKIYRFVKNITFEYGDFSSYILLYDTNPAIQKQNIIAQENCSHLRKYKQALARVVFAPC
jgi:hypothetical protein